MGSESKHNAASVNRIFIPHAPVIRLTSNEEVLTKRQLPCKLPLAKRVMPIVQAASNSAARLELMKTIGQKVVSAAMNAYWMRRMDAVGEAAALLRGFEEIGHYANLGEYFQALCFKRAGQDGAVGKIFEQLSEVAPSAMKPQILLSAGAAYYDRGDYDTAVPVYGEALRAGRDFDWGAALWARRMIAQVKALNGDVRAALKEFESLLDLALAIGRVRPFILHDFLNAYAVVLTMAGRRTEASNVARIVLASPYAPAYPEWRETALEAGLPASADGGPDRMIFVVGSRLQADEPSVAAERPQNVRLMVPHAGQPSPAAHPSARRKKAPVVSLKNWQLRRGMGERDLEPLPPRALEDYTLAELQLRAGRSLYKDGLEKRKLVRMILAVEAIAQDVF